MAKKKAAAKKTAKKSSKKTAKKAAKKAPKKIAKKATRPKTTRRKKVSHEELYRMVQDAAYFKAQSNGFMGDPQAYWTIAEAEILAQFRA
jgi:hypothetical protein